MRSRTSLTRYAPQMRDADPQGPRRAAKEAWLRHGIVVIQPGDVSGMDRELVEAIARRLHGARSGR
ncbi:hypothetical protein [Novosphingobium sp. 9]|uniref:hypothetical protein n=1 Tax=Novosphingobium sp. 9 TaxID=2025349 RepID=UPI0021B4F2ED|nr:hypothetical protein [Novosphingobium sp. 9]